MMKMMRGRKLHNEIWKENATKQGQKSRPTLLLLLLLWLLLLLLLLLLFLLLLLIALPIGILPGKLRQALLRSERIAE